MFIINVYGLTLRLSIDLKQEAQLMLTNPRDAFTGHQTNPDQRSLEVVESGTIRLIGYGFPLVFFSNFDPKTRRF